MLPNSLRMTSERTITTTISDPYLLTTHSHNTMNKSQLIALLRDATNTSELLTRLEDLSMIQQLGATPDQTTGLAAYGRSDEIDF